MTKTTRRSYQDSRLILRRGAIEDYVDFLHHEPIWKDFCSRSPTEITRNRLLYAQLDFKPPYLYYIINAYKSINIEDIDVRNQSLILEFCLFMRDNFIPFLQRIEGSFPDIFVQVDAFFKKDKIPVVLDIMGNLRKHFSEVPLCIIRSMFLWKWRINRCVRFSMKPQSPIAQFVCDFTLAKLQRQFIPCISALEKKLAELQGQLIPCSSALEKKEGLTRNDLLILISKLEHFRCVEGKLLRRRLLGLSVAQNLIKRLSDSHRDMFFLLMRVFGARSFA